MNKAVRWVMVWLFACFLSLVCIGALVKIDRYEPAVALSAGTEQTLRFASELSVRQVQAANDSKKLTVLVDGTAYVASYAVTDEQQATLTLFDTSMPTLAAGTSVMVRIASQTILQKAVGL